MDDSSSRCVKIPLVWNAPTCDRCGQPLYGKAVQLTWIVTRSGNNATYQAVATGPSGTVVSKKFTNPHAHKNGGPPIIPNYYNAQL